MIETRSVQVEKLALAPEKLGYFRYGRVGSRMVVTNDAGEWLLLELSEFRDFLAGRVEPGHVRYEALQERGFLRGRLDVDALADKVGRKKRFLRAGPHLHIVITTLRCNQGCRYCHASRTDMDRVDTDMSLETAKKVVDHAMQTTSPYVNFEFQGGEPTVNMAALQFVVAYSREKNRYENKVLEHSLVTNMTYMNEENANWLLDNGVMVCTSLDGPEDVHNWNRTWTKGNAHQDVLRWIRYFNQKYVDMGRDPNLWHVDALMTTTRKTFESWRSVIDLYVELGIRNIHLRPLNPFGFAMGTWKRIGYSMDEYLAFYAKALDYILELNRGGVQIMEGTAATFLKKMLTPDDPNFVDIRSPVGSGTGQIAYNYDGSILPSDEGRMVDAMGDDIFRVGQVGVTSYADVAGHPTIKALAVSSMLDALPSCSTCWNAPFCGVRPEHNYMSFGDLFAQRPLTPKCKEHMTIATLLLDRLGDDPDGRNEAIFRRWTVNRPREVTGSVRGAGL
jgi:His-Xaa-Ser system radical SAM maturase HxsB